MHRNNHQRWFSCEYPSCDSTLMHRSGRQRYKSTIRANQALSCRIPPWYSSHWFFAPWILALSLENCYVECGSVRSVSFLLGFNFLNIIKWLVMKSFTIFCIATLTISQVLSHICQKPEVIASAYVTGDATVLTKVAFTTQFTLKCINKIKGITLYAEVNNKVLPAVKLSVDNKYQVSILFLHSQ